MVSIISLSMAGVIEVKNFSFYFVIHRIAFQT